ncbi:MAG: SRPBCC domain-containing protein [Candidatus Diapherotrites archaeon]|nr:SRPBCC domain-containing protein [Candidatus Diapherotrites archaeon]
MKCFFLKVPYSRTHSAFTGEKVSISPKLGGKIEAYGGYITGINLELIPEKKIVQTWRASDWSEGLESKVIFEFAEAANRKTTLVFTHSGIPAEQFEEIKKGWQQWYWKPLKKHWKKMQK